MSILNSPPKSADELDAHARPAEARVFVIQQPRPKNDGWTPNLEPAAQYGRLEFIFDAYDKAYVDPKRAMAKAREKLAHFNPACDYLCWAHFGDPATMWLVIMALCGMGFRTLRFLYWSRGKQDDNAQIDRTNRNGYYFPVEITNH